jgi:hypothetical protein
MPSWAGGWDNMFGEPYSLTNQFTATMRSTARLAASVGGQHFMEIGRALANGVGANTELSVMQVQARQHNSMDMGGKIPIAPYVVVPLRPTTNVDKEIFQAQMTPRFAPVIYPVDKSGNGGGGKVGTLNG